MSREGFKLENSIKKEPIGIDAKEKKIDIKMKNIVINITRLFEEEKPENISPSWIYRKLRNNYNFLKDHLPRENNKINYQPLLDLLPQNIVKKWNIQEQRINLSMGDVVDDIIRVFEEEKPENISPDWIFQRLKNDYIFLNSLLSRENNKINYQPFVDLLPKHISERWSVQERRIKISMKDIVYDITHLFEEQKPENISPDWIAQNLRGDYDFLNSSLPKENNKINYQPLLDLLPQNIAEKWNNREYRINFH
jgi:hypothetical protein